jgi:hypothetical protein
MLRIEGGDGKVGMEATSVTYGTQDPTRFQRPTGYQTLQPPGGAAGGAPSRGTALPPPGMTSPSR